VSDAIVFRSRGLVPGSYAAVACDDLDRATVEMLLASWFAWFRDPTVLTIAPAGRPESAELRIRRWKTRPDLVLFRWRADGEARASFGRVREGFEADRTAFELELTPKTKQPRAIVVALPADDVFTPAAAVGLARRAFAAAGVPDTGRYDLTCRGHVLKKGTGARPPIPVSEAFRAGQSIGRMLRPAVRWWRRAARWGRGDE